MSWKITVLQSLIIVSLSYLAIQYFSLNSLNKIQFQQEDLLAEVAVIEEHVERLEKTIKQMIRTKNSSITDQAVQLVPMQNKQESALYKRIKNLEEREKKLEETLTALTAQQENQFQEQNQPEPEPEKVHGWLTTLSEEKKSIVKEIYQEQLALMQNSIPTSPGDTPPSSEDMLSILQENREELKTQLEGILTEEEYDAFLDTLNKAQHPPGLPAMNM